MAGKRFPASCCAKRAYVLETICFISELSCFFFGHVVGLLMPASLYYPFMGESLKQLLAILAGGIFGIVCFVGMTILLWRRLFDPRIRATSKPSDIFVLLLLYVQLILGLVTIPFSAQHLDGSTMVALVNWARHIATFRGDAATFVVGEALVFKLHLVLGVTIFLIFPFTRLVHVFSGISAPLKYLSRSSCQIVRRRGWRQGLPMPIMVNDVEVTDDEAHAEMQYHPASFLEMARYKAARALVIRELILQAAREGNLLDKGENSGSANAEKSIGLLLHREVAVPEADEQSCKRYFEQNRERFVDRKSGEPLPFDRVCGRIREYLQVRSLRTGIGQYISLLAGRARIAGFFMEESECLSCNSCGCCKNPICGARVAAVIVAKSDVSLEKHAGW